jgi:hypothetical protein
MQHESKFRANQEQDLDQQQTTRSTPTEFPSVEAMLRHDAQHTPIPPHIEVRLQKSLEGLPRAARPWWRRLFKGQ